MSWAPAENGDPDLPDQGCATTEPTRDKSKLEGRRTALDELGRAREERTRSTQPRQPQPPEDGVKCNQQRANKTG